MSRGKPSFLWMKLLKPMPGHKPPLPRPEEEEHRRYLDRQARRAKDATELAKVMDEPFDV